MARRSKTGDLVRHPRPPGLLIRGLGGLQRSLRRRGRGRLNGAGGGSSAVRRGVSELQMASSCAGQDRPGGAAVKFVVIHAWRWRHRPPIEHTAPAAAAGEEEEGQRSGGDQWCLVRAGVSIVKLWSDFKDYFQGITSHGVSTAAAAAATKQPVGARAAVQVHTKSVIGVRWLNLQDKSKIVITFRRAE